MWVQKRMKFRKMDQTAKILLKKRAVTFVAALLLLILYRIIFDFSAQDSDESGAVSMGVTEKCVEFANKLSGGKWSELTKREKAEILEHYVRKTAHFCEYACMGILVFGIWRPWKKRDRKLLLLVVAWVFISAALDELHQTFVPGRYGGIGDVVLDTCGGLFGYFMMSAGEKRICGHNRKDMQIHVFSWIV